MAVPKSAIPFLLPLALAIGACPDRHEAQDGAVAKSKPQKEATPPRLSPCVTNGPPDNIVDPKIQVGGHPLTLDGAHLRWKHPDSKLGRPCKVCTLKLGVFADTRRRSPAAVATVKKLGKHFRNAQVDAIVVLGGLDPTFEGNRDLLASLPKKLPLFALAGDLVSREGFQAAVRELGSHAVDLTQIRTIETPAVSFIAIAGYHLAHHVAAGKQGCTYTPTDVRLLAQSAQDLPAPRMLIAYGPPRGEDHQHIDRAYGAMNLGDPALRTLIEKANINFGLFGHLCESGGRAVDANGSPVEENTWSASLFVNVGSADPVPCQRLDKTWTSGAGVLFEIKGERARFQTVSVSK